MGTMADAMGSPEWERIIARFNEQARITLAALGTQITERAYASLVATPAWERLNARINEQAADALAIPEWDRVRAWINEQAGTTLAELGTQITERTAATLVATPEWERLNARINEQAAAALASPEWERLLAQFNERAGTTAPAPDAQIADPTLAALAATPEWERIVEVVAAADIAEPTAPADPSIPPAAITAATFIAVYGILLTLYLNAYERTDDYLLAGNWVEHVELVCYALANISLEITRRLTRKP